MSLSVELLKIFHMLGLRSTTLEDGFLPCFFFYYYYFWPWKLASRIIVVLSWKHPLTAGRSGFPLFPGLSGVVVRNWPPSETSKPHVLCLVHTWLTSTGRTAHDRWEIYRFWLSDWKSNLDHFVKSIMGPQIRAGVSLACPRRWARSLCLIWLSKAAQTDYILQFKSSFPPCFFTEINHLYLK